MHADLRAVRYLPGLARDDDPLVRDMARQRLADNAASGLVQENAG